MQLIIIIDDHKCTCTDTNIHIENSYQVSDSKVKPFLNKLVDKIDGRIVYTRTVNEWTKEWKAHNRLYKLGLYRSHTKHVDLNEDETSFRKLIYKILGI